MLCHYWSLGALGRPCWHRHSVISPSLLRGAPASVVATSIVVVGPPPEWTAATLAAGKSPLVMEIAGLRAASVSPARIRLGQASGPNTETLPPDILTITYTLMLGNKY